MQNCPLTRVFVKRASTGLLLFQWIYVSSLSLCHFLVSRHPSLCVFCFHYSFCLCLTIFILSLCMPLNHIFLLLVSCCHYFHSTACTSLWTFALSIPLWIPGFLFALPSWLCCFHFYIPLTNTPFFMFNLVSHLNFVWIVIFHSSLICPFFPRPICYHLYHLFTLS